MVIADPSERREAAGAQDYGVERFKRSRFFFAFTFWIAFAIVAQFILKNFTCFL
jgi:hypothetical protein